VGAIIQAVMTIYNMVQFFIEREQDFARLQAEGAPFQIVKEGERNG
jgi:hypothetical protein